MTENGRGFLLRFTRTQVGVRLKATAVRAPIAAASTPSAPTQTERMSCAVSLQRRLFKAGGAAELQRQIVEADSVIEFLRGRVAEAGDHL